MREVYATMGESIYPNPSFLTSAKRWPASDPVVLRPVRPLRSVPIRHILLRQVRPETLAYTEFRLATSNQATLPPDLNLNTIAHQDSPLPLILLSAFFVFY